MLQRFHSDIKHDRMRAIKATLLSTPQVLSGVHPATGQAALHVAIESSTADTVDTLRRHGARFADTDRDGNNGLHYVALYGRADLLGLADASDWRSAVTSANRMQSSPLHTLLEHPPRAAGVAAQLVQAFVRHGADPVQPNAHGHSALALASEYPELHDLLNRLVLQQPDPHVGDIADGSPLASPQATGGHGARSRSPHVRSARRSRAATAPFGSSVASPRGGAAATTPQHRAVRTPRSNYPHEAPSSLPRYSGGGAAASPRAAPSSRSGTAQPRRAKSSRFAHVMDAEPARVTRRSASTRASTPELESSAKSSGGGFEMMDGGGGLTFAPAMSPQSTGSMRCATQSAPHNAFAGAAASPRAGGANDIGARVLEAEASISELRSNVASLSTAAAAAPNLQPLEHEVEDVHAAVAELGARVDGASVAAATERERCDGFDKDIKKLQAKASDARRMQRATEDAVREVATFVAELEERMPDPEVVAAAAAAAERSQDTQGAEALRADVSRLSAEIASQKKVVERLRFAVAAHEAASNELDPAVSKSELAVLRTQLASVEAEATRRSEAAASNAAAIAAATQQASEVRAQAAALTLRVQAAEAAVASAAQDAKEAAAAASAAAESARGAEGAPPQPATPPQSSGSADAAATDSAAAVAEVQSDVATLRKEVAALMSAAPAAPKAVPANGEPGPDVAALAARLGRLEEASTVLASQQQQLSRQLKKHAQSSAPTTPRGDTSGDAPSASISGALDPELVQRAVHKLQQRIVSLEQEKQAQHAFNEKQAALLQMLLERVNQTERRLPPSGDDSF